MPEGSQPEPAAPCPACQGRLYPRELACADCGLTVKTSYASNEFADLDDDSLHLLRIFIACEGRIRDMEASLGVSYPTVKARLAGLRETLGFAAEARGAQSSAREPAPPPAPPAAPEPPAAPAPPASPASRAPAAPSAPAGGATDESVRHILTALEAGEIDFDEAMRRIRGD